MGKAALAMMVAAVVGVAAARAQPPVRPAGHDLPPIRHVFVLVLENQSFSATFGAHSAAPYLARALPARGALLRHYYGIGHASLGNYLALISGQAPNDVTQLDCANFQEFVPAAAALDENGQLPGRGCVYPSIVPTLADQLEGAALTWKGYMEDMGNDPQREAARCGHAAVGAPDPTQMATAQDQYATRHDPFVYFHSIIDDPARCARHVVNLRQLRTDLRRLATTPNYVFITPNLCHDGHDDPCVAGRRGGLAAADVFLRNWVPRIERSPAFRKDGLLVITFDEAADAGARGPGAAIAPDASDACCGEKPLPGAKFKPGFAGPGGGRTGAVLLSRFIRAGTVSEVPYNHYSLLRTLERLFALPYLGYAADPQLAAFGTDVFSAARGAPPPSRH